MALAHLLANGHTSLGEPMIRGLASHRRRVLYYLVGVLNHWQPSPMPKRL
ncbi:hypothetical protein SA22_3099 [Salmonella enterica subsp. enterica serovar Agona str. 22.H.04]|nr:hypothetical protein SA73_3371 [Salmonella enterica subsp. enterica serovar Agona str. 73.H.09]CCR05780.1 hypothetical protein SA72_2349 [Salmonella enterica subsp. enterica serovar Agona str. 72.A.52]CCR11228.1 hypothetical protein SA71_3217 [Salmonella enterica subsp. enterica serovar Agona str. 71.E.05]CCR15616.1 hypothetical protein SA70_2999 [Salmonella enterica subsp. enterica serovar Agona str. 70.E.05]CCR19872.1 hypothetical protein SA69_2580 [Salmonella enterica subsp. enterica sero